MNNSIRSFANPFSVTKAVDLNDDQIQALWVNMSGSGDEFAEFARPTTHMPMFVMGAKGSGKTHLMRYHAFELQTLRYRQRNEPIRLGVKNDGYIGIYVRCSGLNSERFSGKRQPADKWAVLFAYYIELWLTQNLIDILIEIELGKNDENERELCQEIYNLFDHLPTDINYTLVGLKNLIFQIRRELDYAVNNCVMTGTLDVQILFTRGKLIFGIPKLITSKFDFLKDVKFVYSLDEFENLTAGQQKFVNTLVREKEIPSTIRIGTRLYGVKTSATLSDNEENLKDSEFEILPLDRLFRNHKDRYASFARSLVERRLIANYGLAGLEAKAKDFKIDWNNQFESIDWGWQSNYYLELVHNQNSAERRHFILFAEKLKILGSSQEEIDMMVRLLSATDYPLIEKVCLLTFYQELFRKVNPLKIASYVSNEKDKFFDNPTGKSKINTNLTHYKTDLIAQLNRENENKQAYLGLDSFIDMSAGLPRGLLTILRSVYEWSHFRGENPVQGNRISKKAQIKGVGDAADWFYDNMRKSGDDGFAIQTVVDRIARLFRTNRFSDKPTECSLIAFSFPEAGINSEARRLIELAESRSFLIRIAGGQRDKNSERVTTKLQLNNMLSPRWDLPLGRRGAQSFEAEDINIIFDPSRSADFEKFLDDWRDRRTAPFFGKARHQDTAPDQQGKLF